MAARPLPTPEPGQTSKSTDSTKTAETSGNQPPLEMVRSVANPPALWKHLNAVMKRRWLRIAGIAVLVFLGILIALPFLINVNRFRPKIESEASTALGRQVTVGNLSLSILSARVGAEDVAIADDPAFSRSPFVTARALKVGVELMPLIFSKQLNVTDITLEEPRITLLKTSGGKWNFSSIGGPSGKKEDAAGKSSESTSANFSVAKLNVNHGRLSVGKANSSSKPVVYDNVNILVKDFSFTSEFPFRLTAQLPGTGDVNISGKAGPINAKDAARTPLTTAVRVKAMGIGALGLIDPASGIAGLANFDGTLTSNGSQARAVMATKM